LTERVSVRHTPSSSRRDRKSHPTSSTCFYSIEDGQSPTASATRGLQEHHRHHDLNIGQAPAEARGLGFQSSNENMVLDKMEELVKARSSAPSTRSSQPPRRGHHLHSLTTADLMQIMELLVQQLNANLVHNLSRSASPTTPSDGYWRRPRPSGLRRASLRRALQRFVETRSRSAHRRRIVQRPAFSRSTWRTTSSSTAHLPDAPTTVKKSRRPRLTTA